MADWEHKVDFVIDAVKGSGFQSTFTKAQAEFTRLGREIQNVQRVQRDVSAYQRQQEAATKTREKLDNLSRQYDLLQREIEETKEANEKAREAQDSGTEAVERSTAALEREALNLKNQITTTTSALNGQENKLKATAKRLEEAGVSTDDLTRAGARLTRQISALKEEQDQAAQSAKAYTESASAGFVNVGQALASAGVLAGLKKIADAYLDCVQTSAGFEAAMSNVGALSGASPDELAALSDKAKEMGAATKYTAQESAEAFGYMALAGWNSEQMLSGIAPVLNLAAASAMDLGQASDIVTDYLTAFGLEAKDAAKFADQMAYAQAHSNTTTADLGEAYKNVAATAKSLGYSVEDTTAVLMAMANAGVKGGEAGSGLSTVMTRLATNTKDCADELSEFGVMVYDENGKMRGLTDIIVDTAGAFNGLTDEEQANLAKAIAGTNQYSKFQTILAGMSESARAGGQSITDYAAALEDCSGTAGKMAETMLDNLSGDLTKLGSAADAVRISLGEQFTPELRKLTQAGTEALSGINQLIERNPAAVKAVTLFTGVMGTATAGLIAYSAAKKAAQALELGSLFASAGPILGVAAGVATVAAAFVDLRTTYEETVPEAMALKEATAALNETLDRTSIADIESDALVNASAAESYLEKIKELGTVQERSEEQEIRYQSALAGLLQVAPQLSDCISQTADKYGNVTYAVNGSAEAIEANIEAMKKQSLMTAYQDTLDEIAEKEAIVRVEMQNTKAALQAAKDQQAALADEQGRSLLDRQEELRHEMEVWLRTDIDKYNEAYDELQNIGIKVLLPKSLKS